MRCDEGKTRYASEEEALNLIGMIAQKHVGKGKTPPPLRTYLCPFCQTWHLTSAPKRDRWAWQMSNDGENQELYERYLQRRRETPIFDQLARDLKLRGRAFR